MPTVQKDAKRMALLEEFYKEKISFKALREERFLAMADKAPFDFSWVDAPKKGKLEAVEEPHGEANFEFLLGFLASFAKSLPTYKAVLMKLSEDFPLVKKADEKLMREAWAEEEAKVQRSMVSYVLLRTRKSEKTRANLPNLEMLKEMVRLFSLLYLEAKKKEEKDEENDEENEEDQEDGEEEDLEADEEEDSEVEGGEMVKEGHNAGSREAEKNSTVKEEAEVPNPKKDPTEAGEIKDPEKDSVKEEVPKPRKDSAVPGEIKDPEKDSVKEEVPKPMKDSAVPGEIKDPKKEPVKGEVPKDKKDTRAEGSMVKEKDPRDTEKARATGSKDPQPDGTKESLECFKKEAEREARPGILDEDDDVQKANGVFKAAAFLASLTIEAARTGLAGPDAANIIKAQQATRAMLRRANNNHEPEGLHDAPDENPGSADEGEPKKKGKGKGKGKPKAKAKGKAKAKSKAKTKAKGKATASPASTDHEDDSEEKEKPKKRGRSREKRCAKAREESSEDPPMKPKVKKAAKARPSSSKPARKRDASPSPDPDSIFDSGSETVPKKKNRKLKPLERSKSEEAAMKSTSEDNEEEKEEEETAEEDEMGANEDPTVPTFYPAGPPRGQGKVLSEDTRRQKVEQLKLLNSNTHQFVLPPPSILKKDQFYIKNADEDTMEEVNALYDTAYKVQARPHVGGMDSSELKLKAARIHMCDFLAQQTPLDSPNAQRAGLCRDDQKRKGFLNAGRLCLRLVEAVATDDLFANAHLGNLRAFLRARVKDGSFRPMKAEKGHSPDSIETQIDPELLKEAEATKKKKATKPASNAETEAKNNDETAGGCPQVAVAKGSTPTAVPTPEAAEAGWPARSWPESYAVASDGPDRQVWQSSSWWGWGYNQGYDDGWANQWHGSWRRRGSSWESAPDEVAATPPPPALHRSNTSQSELDSGVVDALQRLRTFDRCELGKIAQDLEAKFAQLAATPTKAQSVSTTPGSTPSPVGAGSSVPSPTEVSSTEAPAQVKPAETPAAEVKSQAEQGQESKPESSQIVATQAAEDQKQEASEKEKKESHEEEKDPEATKPKEDEGNNTKQGTDEDKKQEDLTQKEQKKADELMKRKKAAHARYMRYYRSVRESPKTPVEIKRMGDKAKNDSAMNSILFEAWEKCQGDWKTSSIYLNLKNVKSTKRTGVRVWMTRAEVIAKFGEEATDAIILRKQSDEKLKATEIRRHPELPESDELVQYLILDTSKFVEEEEEIMEQLYQAADIDSASSSSTDSSSASKKPKKVKKPKNKKQSKDKKDKAKKDKKEDPVVDEVLEELKKKQEEDKKGANVREAAEKDLKESLESLKTGRGGLQEAVDKKDYDKLDELTSALDGAIESFEKVRKMMDQESKGRCSRITKQLAKFCGKNASRDFYKSVDMYTLAKAGWYGDPSQGLEKLFATAYADFKAWLKETKIYSSQRRFKYGLVMKKRDGGLRAPSMNCKAWNGRIVLEYLASVRARAAAFPTDPKIPLQAVAMTGLARFFGISERLPRLLEQEEANQLYHEGMLFINTALDLAQVSVRQMELTWNVTPKMHYFEHQLLETKRSCMNMRFHHCFTDEDAMRWTKLLARKANPPTFEQSVLKKSISRLAALKNHRRLLFAKRSAGRRAQRDAKRS
ncbi:hypothetical protein AK812_SmicGene31512 [Symbiodinium microadriaticum]|uniref:Uncharacterized protein n=1 Tax=Symbiodinium microadriaticum TaxID=2951 RepID=A0A1Q9CWH7_SYMMI|nr:hypothetical protein AK812_SmicGene31512 [Symbiodinium microadriaticum]